VHIPVEAPVTNILVTPNLAKGMV